ncbi:hypothetical protein CS063_01040 [Sporanaerobium hydrogeniformans]|uniref:Uncharacterized protein n=1 Tax=Sporanaerobium hydrogeniformans TaxID=3072179 RepID=A0AC61DGV1_9FIRM|nr:ADP-ribosylglycohydrolase family protein [Sporanaerobium hydrogeniformans]PHV72095.1 hypothetical protein CS063_01040 [Sporanaerobium hydrogeniformans]
MKRTVQHFYGCLMGGAIGDALGAPIAFMKYDMIQGLYGEKGLEYLIIPQGIPQAFISDHTQMTLFTAEGLLRSKVKAHKNQEPLDLNTTLRGVFRAYLRWLYTQGLATPHWNAKDYDGWLIKVKGLHAYREPGLTSITTLGRGVMGSIKKPINDSKGCGGIMRISPVGLIEGEEKVFDMGANIAAITHSHPTGYLASGTLATVIHYLVEGQEIEEAINKAFCILKGQEKSEECVGAINKALELAASGQPTREKLQSLGQGFLAEEALAMAIYCVLSYPNDFMAALRLAINHDGNSGTIGALTGNILGTYVGIENIDVNFIDKVELNKEIQLIAEDLWKGYEDTSEWEMKYPAW